MDDIESYLSVFKRKKTGKSQIDWAKLIESQSEDVGEGITLDFEDNTGTSTFLKPKPDQGISRDRGTGSGKVVRGDNSLKNVSGRQLEHPQLAAKTHHHHLRARDAQSLETSSRNSVSNDTSSLTEVWTERTGALEEDPLSGSDLESDGGRNPLANVKMAEDFFLTGDVKDQRSAKRDRNRSNSDMKGSKPKVVHSETESESEPFQLTRNVFSIDQLKAVGSDEEDEEIDSDESCAGEDSKTDDSSIKFRNVHTLNDLDVHADRTTEPTASCKSREAGSRTSAGERNLKLKATVKVYPENQAVKDNESCEGGYSDEEFESISQSSNSNVVEEEDIVEELSGSNPIESETKSELDVEDSRDINTEASPHYSGKYSPHSSSPRIGGMRMEDYSEKLSENTAEESHTPNEHDLSLSPHRTSTINEDHSDHLRTPKSEEQSAHGLVQPPLTIHVQHEPLYGRENLQDPPLVAPHVVSATTTLEVVAAHSPAIAALNKLMLNQIALTRQFLATSRQATEQLSSGIVSGYQYTTLEETKEYIAKHRPKVLTTKEARKLVKMEEHRRH